MRYTSFVCNPMDYNNAGVVHNFRPFSKLTIIFLFPLFLFVKRTLKRPIFAGTDMHNS